MKHPNDFDSIHEENDKIKGAGNDHDKILCHAIELHKNQLLKLVETRREHRRSHLARLSTLE